MTNESTPAVVPATYGEMAAETHDTTHAEWELTLGDDYRTLRHAPEPLDQEDQTSA